ncbi:hypothetical protein ASPZODRAFT_156359 [Penicilliopsis zonata CBS 506.65]|uniref:DASH complex subunit DUO1 n=1 Tax=Penicilliopsis zonata CBS 506.65 TaxID=1073090 RepID=A0A1L9SWB9_9EURO|nr:hypothetical protein ASPZODRAFT_156359 [Penicilliopsis zonata CBS 506.65]OJJ51488.1 hypothetical protein ASPZODRAFT_156359 [Penicilliopsis zonata CBS 506.65]
MDFHATEEMDRLQLSDEDTEELWNSPSQRHKKQSHRAPREERLASPARGRSPDGETLFDQQEAREVALRNELQSVRNINQVIEGLLDSLDRAKGNMDTVSRTVQSASTLLNTWTRILSQTEHNQRLILNPDWQGAAQDITDMEQEAIQKQQEAERRELELQQRREAAARKAEEDERRRRVQASSTGVKSTRGIARGRARPTSVGRTPSVSYSTTSSSGTRVPNRSMTATTATTTTSAAGTTASRRPASGIARGTGIARGRSRG